MCGMFRACLLVDPTPETLNSLEFCGIFTQVMVDVEARTQSGVQGRK